MDAAGRGGGQKKHKGITSEGKGDEPWQEIASEFGSASLRRNTNLSGVRKAAVLLVAVGEDLAKEILRALPEADVQRLTEELADLRGITPEVSAEVWKSSGNCWKPRTSWCMAAWITPAGCWSKPSASNARTI